MSRESKLFPPKPDYRDYLIKQFETSKKIDEDDLDYDKLYFDGLESFQIRDWEEGKCDCMLCLLYKDLCRREDEGEKDLGKEEIIDLKPK